MSKALVARVLARAFLAGEPHASAMEQRGIAALGRHWPWLRKVADRCAAAFADGIRPRHRDVVRFLRADRGFRSAMARHGRQIAVEHWLTTPETMQPARSAAGWPVPRIESLGELARRLSVHQTEMDWLADLKGLTARDCSPQLRHYHYRKLDKGFGAVRLIESPKRLLKAVQRQILEEILNAIPAHEAAHGFVKRRSIRTFAAPHVGQRIVVRMDLQEFFPSFSGPRIQTFFRTAGYPESVADVLGGLCTTATPHAICGIDSPYARPHLPQGAPTSPALANLCFYRVDCRLAGFAVAAGARYTRYADDLAFSGGVEFERSAERFGIHVAAILLEEGFAVHHRKTRIMRRGVRQQLAGIVANEKLNIRRDDFDRLKAILTNCIRHGPASQNREGHPRFREHLEGRVAFVESIHPRKGERLRALFHRIEW